MKLNKTIKIGFCAWVLLVSYGSMSWGSIGSVISAGAMVGQSGDETGYRQSIKLERCGEILSARPQNSPIHLITLYAPGLHGGHLIIRELDHPGAEVSVLISTTNKVRNRIERANIYVSHPSGDLLLYQQMSDKDWQRLEPIKLIAPIPSTGNTLNEVKAFSVNDIGLFRILCNPLKSEIESDHISKAALFPMGSIRIGILPWICAGMLFIIIGVLSYIIHKIEHRGFE